MMKWFSRIYMGLTFLFLYAPILVLIIFSFNGNRSRASWGGFSIKWYQELLTDDQLLTALGNTVIIAIVASLFAVVIGTAAAIAIHRLKGTGKTIVMNITYLPMLNPDIVTGVALMMFFIALSIPRGMFSLICSHITFCTPYVVISVLPKLVAFDDSLFDAAMDLGCTRVQAYRKIVLPYIAPGIFTGFLLAFTMSVDDFVVSFFATGNGVSNLAIEIYSMARRGINPKINAVLTILFIGVILVTFVFRKFFKADLPV